MLQEKKTYYAVLPGWIDGELRKTGAKVKLTKDQAKYLLLSGQITEDAPVKAFKAPAKETTSKASS
jgi:hypothetical protein